MTKIKIHDKEWFKENCCLSTEYHKCLRPKGSLWEILDKELDTVNWILGGIMDTLAGEELKVMRTDKNVRAGRMNSSRYFAGGYWIPNWAIEWVKED